MESSLRLWFAVLLVAVYSFGIGYGSGPNAAGTYLPADNLESEVYSSDASNQLSYHFTESEKLVSDSRTSSPVTFKTSFAQFLAFVQNSGLILANGFTQYRRISENLLIRYRKADIIFPFHYFW
ncbi:hypothetical protein [Maribellus sp. YY47]|uniref:hypothetical protein n=1 Tax=Maribellus sp. YY47 TaxID=2929486 RepID=UPI00200185AE|nr:hypothetical protein [Maribellus sp. YY47]MCK3683444.1 hypothetical protein [Maribellus sp. YY47]